LEVNFTSFSYKIDLASLYLVGRKPWLLGILTQDPGVEERERNEKG